MWENIMSTIHYHTTELTSPEINYVLCIILIHGQYLKTNIIVHINPHVASWYARETQINTWCPHH
jgi:hypothetical protein